MFDSCQFYYDFQFELVNIVLYLKSYCISITISRLKLMSETSFSNDEWKTGGGEEGSLELQ